MTQPAYEITGDSRIPIIPSRWELISVRGVVEQSVKKNQGNGDENYLSLVAGRGVIPYAEKGDVGNKKPDDLEKCKIVKKGNLVINSMNYAIGSYGMSKYDGVCSPVYVILDPKVGIIHPKFALRIFEEKSFQKHAASFGNGILEHRAAINWDSLKGIKIGLPPLEEQRQIAAYLNREAAKIDKLIAKQQKLIKLLAEKRQAVISQAVTKGLDPSVKMKDSGVEWLGEVPEHWRVAGFLHCLKAVGDIDHYMPESVDDGIPYVMTGDLKAKASEIRFQDCKQVSEFDYKKLSRKIQAENGDVIMARYATIGTACFVDIDKEFLVSYSCVTMKPNETSALGKFIYYYLKSQQFLRGVQYVVNSNTQANVGIGDLKKIKISIPPLNEQKDIVDFVDLTMRAMDDLEEKANSSVSLLKEHRQALITAAVTGKIDVRNLVTDEEVAALDAEQESEEIDENLDDETGEVSYTEGDEEEAL